MSEWRSQVPVTFHGFPCAMTVQTYVVSPANFARSSGSSSNEVEVVARSNIGVTAPFT